MNVADKYKSYLTPFYLDVFGRRDYLIYSLSLLDEVVLKNEDARFRRGLIVELSKNTSLMNELFGLILPSSSLILTESAVKDVNTKSVGKEFLMGYKKIYVDKFCLNERPNLIFNLLNDTFADYEIIDLKSLYWEVFLEYSDITSHFEYVDQEQSFYFHEINFHKDGIRTKIPEAKEYKLTLITSMIKGSRYIKSYIENLILVPYFNSIELLIFDVNSDFDDAKFLLEYLMKYKNIKYFRLKDDPGLYDIWNLGIYFSSGKYIGNANLDDRRDPNLCQILTECLDFNSELDLVSSHVIPVNDLIEDHNFDSRINSAPHIFYSWMKGSYDIEDLFKIENGKVLSNCIPHCMPIWRKDLHIKYGFFDEKNYSSAADYGFWLRCLANGANFHLCPIPGTFYYINPSSYMRQDPRADSIVEDLYHTYITNKKRPPVSYYPNFKHLISTIGFKINYEPSY